MKSGTNPRFPDATPNRWRTAWRFIWRGLSVSEVALEVGFFDQSHFSVPFKRACGLTPRQFRRRFQRQSS